MSPYPMLILAVLATCCVLMGQAEFDDPSCRQELSTWAIQRKARMMLAGDMKKMRNIFPRDSSLYYRSRMMCMLTNFEGMPEMDETKQMSASFQMLAEVLKMQVNKAYSI